MQFGTLVNAVKGQIVLFPHYVSRVGWRVVRVRDRRNDFLEPDTYRRRPEVLRSQSYVVLRNVVTGHLWTRYFAESIPCMLVDD
jgi:hypothetical protein